MGMLIGIIIIVAAIVGFMYINDISERKKYGDVQKELGEKFLKEEDEK